jgi:hypothetical protein
MAANRGEQAAGVGEERGLELGGWRVHQCKRVGKILRLCIVVEQQRVWIYIVGVYIQRGERPCR